MIEGISCRGCDNPIHDHTIVERINFSIPKEFQGGAKLIVDYVQSLEKRIQELEK